MGLNEVPGLGTQKPITKAYSYQNLNPPIATAEKDSNHVSGFSEPSDTMSEYVRKLYFSTGLSFQGSIAELFNQILRA